MTDFIDKLPPQNLEAEQGVLGSMILDNDTIVDVTMMLRTADFYRDGHKTLYRAIIELSDKGEPVDLITLSEDLTRRNELDRIGGDDFLAEIVNSVPHALNARYYADIVRQKSIARRLAEFANETLRDVYSNNFTAEQLTESAEIRLVQAVGDFLAGDALPITDYQRDSLYRIACRKDEDYSRDGVPTGLIDIDDMVGDMPKGALIIVAARPAMGKSILALQLALNAAHAGTASLVISLEMSGIELAERSLVAHARVDGHKVRSGQINDSELQRLGESCEAMLDPAIAKVWLGDEPNQSMMKIASMARRAKLRHKIGLLVIDYLQLVDPGDDARNRENRQVQVAAMSRRLKILAKELAIPVLCVAQLNRQSEGRQDKRPQLADLRESGAIEQDADMVWLLHRPEFYDPNDMPGVAELIIAKNRNGRPGKVRLTFQKAYMRFENYSAAMPVETNGF